jgi:IMP dehydrogenase
MIGSLFAGTDEAPGKLIKRNGKFLKVLEEWDQLVQ